MSRLAFSQLLLLLEALTIVAIYQVYSNFECQSTNLFVLCRGVRLGLVLGLCLAAGLALLLFFRPTVHLDFAVRTRTPAGKSRRWGVVHVLGVVIVLAPVIVLSAPELTEMAPIFLAALLVGGLCALIGGAFWLMPWSGWQAVMQKHRAVLLPTILVSLLIPTFAWAFGFAWNWFSGLQWATFYGVAIVLAVLGNDVFVNLDFATIGVMEFYVEVAESCSGIEGLALTTAFMVIYTILMKDDLRLGRFWLLVWPAALLTSFIFNIMRISVLILIGAYVSPDLAVNGFHSFAGWLSFTVLALLILALVHLLPGLSKADESVQSADLAPLTEDRVAAQIAPFLAFMLVGLVVQTISQTPEVLYGVQVAAMALALWLFRKPILGLVTNIDVFAVAAGGLVGIGWIATAQTAEPYASLAQFGTGALALWVVLRVIGTSLLVPIVEELFFRGYLFGLIDDGRWPRRLLAIAITTAGFAALHSRPVAGAVAGIIFTLVLLRRGKLFDAIVSHAVANALIAAAALITGQWALI